MEYFDKFIDFLVALTIKFLHLMAEKPSEMILAFLILIFLIAWASERNPQQPQSEGHVKTNTYQFEIDDDPPETTAEMLNRIGPDLYYVERMNKTLGGGTGKKKKK